MEETRLMSTPVETPPEGTPPPGSPTPRPEAPPAAPEPAKTFDQDAVDRIVADRLARERAKYADYNDLKSAAEKLREIEDAQKTEAQRLEERAAAEVKAREEAEGRARDLEVQLLRQRVAAAKGLTPAQAARLRGDSEEEITADADELLAAFALAGTPPVARTPVEALRPGAMPPGDASTTDMNEWMRRKTPRS